jgi:HEXXH motif-containing protein
MTQQTHSAPGFLSDLEFSALRAEKYWEALRTGALARYLAPAPPTRLPLKSTLWSAWVYAEEDKLSAQRAGASDQIEPLLAAEDRCFDGMHLSAAQAWLALTLRDARADLRFVDGAGDADLKARYDEAMGLLRAVWPAAATEYAQMVKGIAWFESREVENFSDPKMFGVVHLNRKPVLTPAEIAVDVVHECGHHALFIETAVAPLFLDPKAEIYSPLRRQQRPAIGVLHAAVAMGRMLMLAARLGASQDPTLQRAAEQIEDDYRGDQRETLVQLARVELAEAGARLLADLQRTV